LVSISLSSPDLSLYHSLSWWGCVLGREDERRRKKKEEVKKEERRQI
jgi:hypothetical protein